MQSGMLPSCGGISFLTQFIQAAVSFGGSRAVKRVGVPGSVRLIVQARASVSLLLLLLLQPNAAAPAAASATNTTIDHRGAAVVSHLPRCVHRASSK